MKPIVSSVRRISFVITPLVLVFLSCSEDGDKGGLTDKTSLQVVLLDNAASNRPFPGAYVILHGRDNRTVEGLIQTDERGVADFGDIGRTRATITIAYEILDYGFVAKQIRTFQNVQVGDISKQ